MAIGWLGGTKTASLADLIARKKYGRAIEVLREQFREGIRDPRMRLQLADLLVMAGRQQEAMPILSALADEFAREGFAAKAIAVLKRLEKIAPGRPDVERRLAALIHKKLLSTAPAPSAPADEIGIEDLGLGDAFASPAPAAGTAPEPATPEPSAPEGAFEEEFFGALQDMIEAGSLPEAEETASGAEDARAPAPLLASPLFGGFSEDELGAVIARLQLLSFEPGDIVVSEGEPGRSLFILTTGSLKAFVRDRAGRNVPVREMSEEGSFFGEVSILSGKARSATVTCATSCELLELDLPSLREIVATHPHVRQVIEAAYQARAGSEEEMQARARTAGAATSTR